MKQKIRLTEGDLHRIIRKCVNEALENDMIAFESSHINPNTRNFTVIANFYDYTYCFKHEIVGKFNNYDEAKRFALEKIKDEDFMYDLAEDAYAEMEEDYETPIDDINFEIFENEAQEPIFVTKGYASLRS